MQESPKQRHPCPHSSCLLSALKGFSTGVTFAVKVRFTHALVISVLFRSGTLLDKLKFITEVTLEHAGRLGCYVAVYKMLQCLLTRIQGKMRPVNSFCAGALSGFLIFGSKTMVTSQMILYLLGRVVSGFVKLILRPLQLPKNITYMLFPATSILCWGIVMLLFRLNEKVLQPSLTSSMRLLYVQSDTWKSSLDFVPFGSTIASYLKP